MKKGQKLIAVTGGIGSGKTTALEIIQALGKRVISCDQITSELYENQEILQEIKKIVPQGVSGEKTLKAEKMKISEVVFNDSKKLKQLSDYIGAMTFEKAVEKAKETDETVFIEVPLLFENGLEKKFDSVIVVTRDIEDRITSVMERSKLNREQVKKRIKNQYDYSKIPKGVVQIQNDGDVADLTEKVKRAIEEI